MGSARDGNDAGMTGRRPMDPNTHTPDGTGLGMGTAPLLEVEDLHVTIQAMEALRGLSVRMASGSMVGLIGRNGAGKTTLMRTVMGHLKPARGRIAFEGRDLAAAATHARAAFGIGYMPEDRQLVPQLTVEENILLPIWVSKSLQARPRLDFVYGVMPELAEMRDRKALLGALSVMPEYLRNAATASGAVIDYRDWQVPLGRRFRALKLWFVLRHYGARGLRAYIREHVRQAELFASWVRADARFELAVPRSLALVCFRLRPRPGEEPAATDARNRQLLERLNASGKAFLTHTVLPGVEGAPARYVLRMAIGSPRTEERHVRAVWEQLVALTD